MRKLIASVVVVSVLMPGMVFAQEPVLCRRPNNISENWWNQATDAEKTKQCAVVVDSDAPVSLFAPVVYTPPVVNNSYSKEMRSPKLAIAGGITALVGLIMVVPQGHDYAVLGSPYCVSDYSVDEGRCGSYNVQYGLAAIGTGVTMMLIGAHSVSPRLDVAPIASKSKAGAAAVVRWGK